jgi:hypothetical protein
MSTTLLREQLSFDQANLVLETEGTGERKDLFLKGIFIQAAVENQNKRIYPVEEISKAVDFINEQIAKGHSVLGEVDHPADLKINLDRVSHVITKMWMDGPNGFGKMRIIPTPMGNIVKTMLDCGVKLGVSSRGSGEVDDGTGKVRNFEIVTVDIVAQPSAPNAYPKPVFEGLMNMQGGHRVIEASKDVSADLRVQKYLRESVLKLINELKLK